MQFISLAAHFDGQRIVLDEPFELPPNAPLMVTVLPHGAVAENSPWAVTAAMGLARAYGENEPDYTLEDVQ
jgi:hypothetical protein